MNAGSLLAFWGVSMLFVVTPGADWAYAITAGIARRTVPAVTGMLTGYVIVTGLVAGGVGGLVARSPLALTVLTVAGSFYLLWLGIGTLRQPASVGTLPASAPAPWGRWWVRGSGVSGFNPKVYLLFLAVLPQFADPSAGWPLAAQIAILGLVHTASCAVVYLGVGFGAGAVLGSRPTAARRVSTVSGVAMIVIALFLLAERAVAL